MRTGLQAQTRATARWKKAYDDVLKNWRAEIQKVKTLIEENVISQTWLTNLHNFHASCARIMSFDICTWSTKAYRSPPSSREYENPAMRYKTRYEPYALALTVTNLEN